MIAILELRSLEDIRNNGPFHIAVGNCDPFVYFFASLGSTVRPLPAFTSPLWRSWDWLTVL